MGNFVTKVIKYAFWLTVAGELKDATLAMMKNTYKAQSNFVSLSALNRQLVGPSPKVHKKKSKSREL